MTLPTRWRASKRGEKDNVPNEGIRNEIKKGYNVGTL